MRLKDIKQRFAPLPARPCGTGCDGGSSRSITRQLGNLQGYYRRQKGVLHRQHI